jgi:hypothetical protein
LVLLFVRSKSTESVGVAAPGEVGREVLEPWRPWAPVIFEMAFLSDDMAFTNGYRWRFGVERKRSEQRRWHAAGISMFNL